MRHLRSALLCAGLALGVVALAASGPAGDAQTGRVVQCRVETGGKVVLSRPCRFTPDGGGSFALQSLEGGEPLFGEITTISVAVVAPGAAEVRGLTRAGINSRWGEASRSRADPACWDGAGFRICAR